MNKRIDFSFTGGFPATQYMTDYMQTSYRGALGALASCLGDKVIVSGCDIVGGVVTNGWISYGGEITPFIGGPYTDGDSVVITEGIESRLFQDNMTHDVYYKKEARIGSPGVFVFSEMERLLSFQNIWRPGDIKEKYCDDVYIAANFDGNGYGINAEKGWRIFSKQVPEAAGKAFVNVNTEDAALDTPGKYGGSKTSTVAKENLPAYNLQLQLKAVGGITPDNLGGGYGYSSTQNAPIVNIPLGGSGTALDVENPFFVILKLVKL